MGMSEESKAGQSNLSDLNSSSVLSVCDMS